MDTVPYWPDRKRPAQQDCGRAGGSRRFRLSIVCGHREGRAGVCVLKGKLELVRWLSTALIALGGVVMLGWLCRIAALTTLLPGLNAMVFNAALSFALLGAALLCRGSGWPSLRRAAPVCGSLVLLLAVANLAQIASGRSSGINLAALQDWSPGGSRVPGQMPFSTSLCFLLTSLSSVLLGRPRGSTVVGLGRIFAGCAFGIGLLALCGYALQLEPLYSWYPMSQMALHTALGMTTLGSALWLSWSDPRREYREDQEIVEVGTTALVIVAVLSALTGIWVLRTQGAETLDRNLQTIQKTRAEVLITALDQRGGRLTALRDQPSLLRAVRALADAPGDGARRLGLQRELAQIVERGFDGAVLYSTAGLPLAAAGSPIPPPELELPVKLPQPGRSSLVWRGRLVLRGSIELRDAAGSVGELVVEHASPALENTLLSSAGIGDSGVASLCGASSAGPACLPGPGQSAMYRLQDRGGDFGRLMAAALAGATGAGHLDLGNGHADSAAYGPVGTTGLSFLVQVNASALYAPIRHGLLLSFVLVGTLVLAAAIWLRRQISALARRLRRANTLREAILDAAPLSVVATDTNGLITAVNPAAERMLGYSAAELIGKSSLALLHDPHEMRARAAELGIEPDGTAGAGFEVFARQARAGVVEEREWSYVRKDGARFPVQLTVTTLRSESGHITGFLGIASDITERKRQEAYTQHVAHHDSLTGLPNRTLLQDRMQAAIQRARGEGGKIAAMMIDLDHFKRVNDSLGHHVGDQLLKTVAERILGCVRGSDTVARMGGDEFVVLLADAGEDAAIERVAAQIIERIAAPIPAAGYELLVTPSIGISRYPEDGEDLQALLMNADSAMYRAKAAGRQTYRLFSRDMQLDARNRIDLEGAMRQALKLGEFSLHYQPQVNLEDGEVSGMEALLRWRNPRYGTLSPADFIPVAEESGLIVEIGAWVLATACREARLLQMRTGRPLRVAVNLSPRQFRQADLAETVQRALQDSGLAPEHLELEITEGVLMAHTADTVERLRQLRALGVSIAVDDFGVGFSSLSYIAKFPISTLKIDRIFVNQLPDSASDAAVALAILALARSLNIKVVAEGVETRAQLEFLMSHRCDLAQGYHLGRPVPMENFHAQGFHFGKALAVDTFVRDFDKMRGQGRRSIVVAGG